MVAINLNMDLGDAWEHADTPEYPQPNSPRWPTASASATCIYAMSH